MICRFLFLIKEYLGLVLFVLDPSLLQLLLEELLGVGPNRSTGSLW